MSVISRLLIANRGEVVARVARTARRLGIATIGVYSDPDRSSPAMDGVDVAVSLGGTTPTESYLDVERVLDAARRSDADAVHPGYGFLAESADFARAVVGAGLTWVGPRPDQIEAMGDKIEAKRLAAAAGVPILETFEVEPGSAPPEVAMPALVKAAAGGGGKGMRLVEDPSGLAEAIESAGREAASAFGDGRVFVESYIAPARHIEVQVLGDGNGGVVHIGDRDCSIQRRHQKIVEEAPAFDLSDRLRTDIHDASLRLASSLDYAGVGTVEFVVRDEAFWFLEMNTRLQVEHPVTEEVYGLDLVELQLAVAQGRPVPSQGEIDAGAEGHAIEVRLYAENPVDGWAPSVGTLHRYRHGDVPGVRHENGVAEGSVVSPFYDPMLAKVVSHGPDRAWAAAALATELEQTHIHGVTTNAAFLAATLRSEAFGSGTVTTDFIDRHPHLLQAGPDESHLRTHLAAVIWMRQRSNRARDRHWGFAPSGWRNLATQGQRVRLDSGAVESDIEYRVDRDRLVVASDGAEWTATVTATDHGPADLLAVEIDGLRHAVTVHQRGPDLWANSAGGQSHLCELPRFVEVDAEVAGGGPTAPVPGTVITVDVQSGDRVEAGQTVAVVEAMKMEHRITASSAATVTEVLVRVGDQVDAGQVLVRLTAQDEG